MKRTPTVSPRRSFAKAAAALTIALCTLTGVSPSAVATDRVTVPGGPALERPAPSEAVRSAEAAPAGRARPRIGVALSGGGARGFAHVGVLRALEALRVPVDCIAGTSAGSAVGAAYAVGLSPAEIERALRSADWDRDIFDDAPPRRDQQPRRRNEQKAYLLDLTVGYRDGSLLMPPGLIAGQKVELFLHRMLGASTPLESFDRLPIPFRAIATDLEVGEMVVQDRGSLVTAVRASMAVPSAFSPVSSGGRLLVDGGLTRNMPVDVVRDLCADVVIAVDIGGPLLKRDDLGNAFGVAAQMINILMERNMRDSRAELRSGRDVMIRPELGDIGATSFSRGVDGIPAGEAATLEASADLARLALAPDEYAAWQARRAEGRSRDERYAGVRVIGTEASVGRAMLSQARLGLSGTLDRSALERAINGWNSSGDFERIGYSLQPSPAGQVLEIDVVERSWGPNFLRFGLGAAADSNANSVFNVLVGYRRPRLTRFGTEFKSELQFGTTSRAVVELFQPFTEGDARWFANPQLLAEEVPVWLYSGRDRVAEYAVTSQQAGLDIGLQGRLGEIRLGAFIGQRHSAIRTGSPLLPDLKARYTGSQLSILADQLDAIDFPREGFLLGLSARLENVDADGEPSEALHRTQAVGKIVGSWGDHTVAAAFRAGEASARLPMNQLFSFGGFMNLSGLQLNQQLGTSVRYASLSYQNQILTLPNPIGRGVYAGLAVETGMMRGPTIGLPGDVWQTGLTAYLGASTAIGPVYVGYGSAGGGNRLVYLFLGRPGL